MLCIVTIFSVCLTIGAYSKWLDSASCGVTILPSVLEILMNGMGTSEECAAVAALAFRHICDGIYSELVFECICELYVQCLPLRMLTSCLGELQ